MILSPFVGERKGAMFWLEAREKMSFSLMPC